MNYEQREADWRMGAVVYQIMVDRFASSEDLEAKRELYASPRRLRPWSATPKRGKYVKELGLWSQEVDFWGGDLKSLRGKLAYLDELGVDVVYLNPIHEAFTNHKYDASDWAAVDPQLGTRQDVIDLASDLHQRGKRLMLDGVFNHIGRRSPWFKAAQASASAPEREDFFFDDDAPHGYRAWADAANLPEVRIERETVQDRVWKRPDSVVQGYLRDGVDGWRLDVAYDIGFDLLASLRASAREAKPDAAIIGEIWTYPDRWFDSVDGIYNLFFGEVLRELFAGRTSVARAGRLISQAIEDGGIEGILRSWTVLDSHDVARLRHILPEFGPRSVARALQFLLPGSPLVYYGTELGMKGGNDPENRAPMRWDKVSDRNTDLAQTKQLIALRKARRALRVGDFRLLDGERLLAFLRYTDRALDGTIVVANPSAETRRERLPVRDGRFMNVAVLEDALGGPDVPVYCGLIDVELPAWSVRVLSPKVAEPGFYTAFKRTP